MQGRGIWRLARALALVGVVTITTASVAPLIVSEVPTVLADNKRDKDDKDQKSRKNVGHDRDEDHVLRGQVLQIDTIKDPPELIMATTDGPSLVKVLKTDEIAINGVRLGDHIEINGEKISEVLFEATEISVSEHYSGAASEGSNNDNKN